jgi:undecaprenyl-diphosphatase
MSFLEAIVLGAVQGITEFLPISSSAHLLLIPYLFHWQMYGLTFDIALHFGTLLAVLIYFSSVWVDLFRNGLVRRQKKELALLTHIAIATIPAALIGYFGGSVIESAVRQPAVAAVMLIIFGIILWWADAQSPSTRDTTNLTWKDALLIGLSQCLSLVPGVSRSGVTMTSSRLLGLSRDEAARFSFLLLAPITAGAVASQLGDALKAPNYNQMLVGALVSFLVGLAAIHFMLAFIKRYGFKPYMYYRVAVGLLILVLVIVN